MTGPEFADERLYPCHHLLDGEIRGIDRDRLVSEGKGETQPIDTNDTAVGRARNRRIEFEVIK